MTTTENADMRLSMIVPALLILAACASAPTATRQRVHAPATRLPDVGGLRNVARLTPSLYRGAQPDAAGYQRLKDMGIKTVISFRCFTDTREEVEAAGLDYVMIPIYASIGSSPPTDDQLAVFFDTILDPARQPVFMHCKHGKDRTGLMAGLFRMERQGWSNREAVEEMQQFGYHDIFRDLIRFAREYTPRGFAPPAEIQP